jgi:hypothetical protein
MKIVRAQVMDGIRARVTKTAALSMGRTTDGKGLEKESSTSSV